MTGLVLRTGRIRRLPLTFRLTLWLLTLLLLVWMRMLLRMRWRRPLLWCVTGLGERGRPQQKRCRTAHEYFAAQHTGPLFLRFHGCESYGFAVTSSCTYSWSSTLKSAYRSSFLSSACRSPTAVPGCTGGPGDGGLVAMVSG